MPALFTDSSGALKEPTLLAVGPVDPLAATGTVIGNAAAIVATTALAVVSGGNDAAGVQLPVAQVGKVVMVYGSASNGLKVYPQVNSTIANGSANAAVTVEGRNLAIFVGVSPTNWAANFLANA